MSRQSSVAVAITLLAATCALVHAHTPPTSIGVCQSVPGYDVMPNSHVDAATGCRYPTADTYNDAASAASACSQDISCNGFAMRSADGATRKLLCTRPTVIAGGVCLYTKITNAVCKTAPGFIKVADSAYLAEDGGVLSTDINDNLVTLSACASDPACQTASYDTALSSGMTLSIADQSATSYGSCAYYKVISSCQYVPGYNAQIDMNLDGSTITIARGNISSYATACASNPSCVGFNSAGQLKNANSPLAYTRGTCFYSKNPKPLPTGCPQISGFTVSYNRDNAADTTTSSPGAPVAALASQCSTDTKCKGFNTRGELKSAVRTLATTPGVCFYTKISTVCRPYPGYDAQVDVIDSSGADWATDSIAAAFALCESRQSCTSFNSLNEVRQVSAGGVPARGVCTYVKVKPACPVVVGYAAASDTDIGGNTIATVSTILGAKRACDANAACLSFNSKGATKSVAYGAQYTRGTCLYVKQSTPCPPVPGYTAYPDTNVLKSGLQNFKTTDAAATFCEDNDACGGFSVSGPIIQGESVDSVPEYCRGSCYYKKGTTCADVPGYRALPGYEPNPAVTMTSEDTPDGSSVNNAYGNCNYTEACTGFSYRAVAAATETGVVYHSLTSASSNVSNLVKSDDACFYAKIPTVCREIRRGWVVETDRAIPNGVWYTDSLSFNWFGCAINGINVGDADYYPNCFGITSDGNVGLETDMPSIYSYGVCHWYKDTWDADAYTTKISYKKKAYASSSVSRAFPPSMAVDGIVDVPANRWVSQNSSVDNDLWLSVDLGDVWGITRTVVYNRIECCKSMLGADFGSRIYYTNLTMQFRNQSDAIDQETIAAGKTYEASILYGNSDLLEIVLETNKWESGSPGVGRWAVLHKKIGDASAQAGNITFGTPEFEVYGIALPRLFRDDLPYAQRLIGY